MSKTDSGPRMLTRLKEVYRSYPGQFWLLFWGMLLSTIGSSMIWPFLMLYVSKKLQLPLTQIATLLSLNALMGFIFSFIAGPITDRLGRKWVMVVSLVGNGCMYLLLSRAETFLGFAVAQGLMGALNPLYRVGADAMLADLIPEEKRPAAYSIMRMSNNAGISIGPAIGGIIAAHSYSIAFFIAAFGMTLYGLLVALKAKETLPQQTGPGENAGLFEGYGKIFRDHQFIGFAGAFTLTSMLASLLWVILPVHANAQFGIPESQYGFIPTTNAIMVVLLQYTVTLVTRRFRSLPVMTVATAFYALAVGMVALFSSFWGFWLCMVVMTIGELMLVPTATAYTAKLAPANMRGRYMSIYTLTWSIASGTAPVMGGLLSDNLGSQTVWIGGGMIGLLSIFAFIALTVKFHRSNQQSLQHHVK